MRPTVGAIVHYVGGPAGRKQCRAAIVSEITDSPNLASLMVFEPGTEPARFIRGVTYAHGDAVNVSRSHYPDSCLPGVEYPGQTWHFLPRQPWEGL